MYLAYPHLALIPTPSRERKIGFDLWTSSVTSSVNKHNNKVLVLLYRLSASQGDQDWRVKE